MLQNEEYIQSFVEEAKVHVETVENGLVNMDLDAVDPEEVNNIFRAVHSMKGTAGFFNLTRIVELSHCMENLFGEIRNGKLQLRVEMIDILLAANDCLKSMVDDVLNSESTDISSHVEKISYFLKADNKAGPEAKGTKKNAPAPAGRDAVPETRRGNELIADAIRHGHFYYMLRAGLNEDLLKNGINPVELIKSIKSIGNFIELKTAVTEASAGEEDDPSGDIILEYYFTTVLEKGFLPEALNVTEKCLFELNIEVETEKHAGPDERQSQAGHEAARQEPDADKGKEAISKKNQGIALEDSIRVHVSLLNDLLNLASEMVLGRNQLLRAMEKNRKSIAGIDSILQNIDHITTELQEKVMQTRMQPISNVFSKFPRIIRELAKKLGKEIDLSLEGSEVELDKSIIEALGDPLTHLVRNAADHGLEAPEEREKIGKPRTGNIIMKAYHEGGYVNIDVIDDGAGINVERIKEKAIEKGIINKNDTANMGEQEILQLLFKPGFSTAEKVTDVSGRGVGMDVVKTNIEKLGGTIEIFTAASQGTTFRLLLPLTLAIIPSLIVQAEDQRFALPQVNLQEIVRIKPGSTTRKIEFINNSEVLRLRGGLLPIVHLADVLGLKRTYVDPETNERKDEKRRTIFGYRHEAASPSGSGREYVTEFRMRAIKNIIRILVIKIGSRKLGIAVDAIHGSEEILVKPLPSFIKDCKCYSGVTIMGDGKTAMILDPEGIIVKANLRFIEGGDDKSHAGAAGETEGMGEQQSLLLFKCSGTETLAIDLSMVSRVEEIRADEIERIGDKEYIKFRGDSLRVIRPEDFLPLSKQKNDNDKLYVIIPKLVRHPMGIIIEKIHDTMQKGIVLNHEDITAKGFVGSTILNNRIVLLLNIYELFEIADPANHKIEKIKHDGKLKILLVEDTPFFQKLEKSYLEEAGYQVITANHGREALQILQDNKVDAVVSDIHMPVMDGIELVKKIRADKSLADLPVLAVTSLTGDLQKKAGLDAGFDMYEFKLDRVRLLEVLEKVLSKGRKAV